jgi:hypothetical protein
VEKMKDHTYYALIGIPLDKIQEGSFNYSKVDNKMTLSEYAIKVREEVDKMSKSYTKKAS